MLVLCLEFGIYQKQNYQLVHLISPDKISKLYALNAHKSQYQNQREAMPVDQRGRDALQVGTIQYEGEFATYIQAYSLAQFDPCMSNLRANLMLKSIKPLIKLYENRVNEFFDIVGCERPKMRLLPYAYYINDDNKIRDFLKNEDNLYSKLVVSSDKYVKPLNGLDLINDDLKQSQVHVTHFYANKVNFNAEIDAPHGAWVVYADSFHNGWKAFEGKKEIPIYKAYGAFKALYLSQGKHDVKLVFTNGIFTGMTTVLITLGTIFAILAVVLIGVLILFSNKLCDKIKGNEIQTQPI